MEFDTNDVAAEIEVLDARLAKLDAKMQSAARTKGKDKTKRERWNKKRSHLKAGLYQLTEHNKLEE